MISKANDSVFLLVAAMVLTTLPVAALAQKDLDHKSPKYSEASIQGDYAVVATYGSNIARAVGTQKADGQGNLTGSATVNQPAASGARTTTSITFGGTYVVKKNGTGTFSLTVNLPNGRTAEVTEDFVITKAEVINGVNVATEIVDQQREPSAAIDGDVLVTHTYTRRPEGGA
jgi:hypothetical protein